jgi:hypothetical protein
MDKDEAREILRQHLAGYRSRAYADLVSILGQVNVAETAGQSGTKYQIEVEVFWDDKSQRNLRVLASIDDGGWRAWAPLSDSFILAPDGTFVGE